jgi:membrane protein involved in colicin uptake
VKVDPKLLLGDNSDKENAQPLQLHKQGEEETRVRQMKEQGMAEERRKQAEEAAKRRKEEETAARQNQERVRQEAHKAAEDNARQEAEEKRREEEAAVAAKAVAAAAAAVAEEQRVRQEAQRAAEEQARREREAAELVAAQGKIDEWCKNNGFQDLNTQKKTYMGARKFALHTAVKHTHEEMVGLLLKCGADKFAKDSRKQTASELAANMNKKGSHDQILTLLL